MLPNFLVIGANKSGTTSLHRYLMDHPQVFMSAVKEPSYFALGQGLPPEDRPDYEFTKRMVHTRQAYEALFDAVDRERAVGEASTAYLHSRPAAASICKQIPDVKLIAILRDPSERARSAHSMYVSKGLEPLHSFEAAIGRELDGCPWRSYVKRGRYHEGLAPYFELFEPRQLKVLRFEHFRDRTREVLGEIFTFLDVDPNFSPDISHRHNASAVPRSPMVTQMLESRSPVRAVLGQVLPAPAARWVRARAIRWNRVPPPASSPEARRLLIEEFRDGIGRLEAMTDLDLSGWLEVRPP